LRRRRYRPSTTILTTELATSPPVLPNQPSIDAIFTPALVSDVQWQAQDATVPMIIVTEGAENRGSWYLPVNEVGQIQLRYTVSQGPSPSTSPRSSEDLEGRFRSLLQRRNWLTDHLSLSSHSRRQVQMMVSYTDETPLLVEFLSAEELKKRVSDVKYGRNALLWIPIRGFWL
jgi:hypothetical protein